MMDELSEDRLVDPSALPYPWPPGASPSATSRRSGRLELVTFLGAISAGTAQFPIMYSHRRRAPVSSSEGPLVFYQDRVVFYADNGDQWACTYDWIDSYTLKRGLRMCRLTLHRAMLRTETEIGRDEANAMWFGGRKVWFRVSRKAAKNAAYVLAAKGLASTRG